MNIQFYKKDGEKAESVAYPKEMETEISQERILDYVRYLRNNQRQRIASTKDRSEVSGSGAKPWRQKGTGRARHGSRRSPIWVGGGIAFGPKSNRNYKIRLNKKEKRKAFLAILTSIVKDKSAVGIVGADLPEPRTKSVASLIEKLPLKGTIGVIVSKDDQNWQKSARNIAFCKPLSCEQINGLDLLNFDSLLITKEAFSKLISIFSEKRNHR